MATTDVLTTAVTNLQNMITAQETGPNAALYTQRASLINQINTISAQIAAIEPTDVSNARQMLIQMQRQLQRLQAAGGGVISG